VHNRIKHLLCDETPKADQADTVTIYLRFEGRIYELDIHRLPPGRDVGDFPQIGDHFYSAECSDGCTLVFGKLVS
jgi:hypothetical protein